jgi:hypothetical protein
MPLGYTRAHTMVVSPRMVSWFPVIFFTLSLLCTFFTWVGAYFGGDYPVYSQRPWGAIFGGVKRDFVLEQRMQISASWLDKVRSDWELMVPYLVVLVLAVLLAWAERGIRTLDPRNIPPMARVWPWRLAIMAGLGIVAFVLVMIQVNNGFGMERAIRKSVNDQFAEERAKAASSPARLEQIKYQEDQEFAKNDLERTVWLYVGIICNVIAVLAVFGHIALDRRGSKPPPRIVIQY